MSDSQKMKEVLTLALFFRRELEGGGSGPEEVRVALLWAALQRRPALGGEVAASRSWV